MNAPVELSVVLPCLNEKPSLEKVISEIKETCDPMGIRYEIIVADNGSDDTIHQEAAQLGARVVPVEKRGYGAAVNGGILAAKGEIVVFGDADGSYPFCEIPRLIAPLRHKTADLVVGNRLGKQTPKKAMPVLYRYLGTPIISFLIRFFHGLDVFDCNSGLRALRREKYAALQLKQPGIEYASEMLIRAQQCGWKYLEIPVALRPKVKERVPPLPTWGDGFRHVRTVLSACVEGIKWRKNILLLLVFMLACGLYGLTLGKDAVWDLFNYHLYNPFALFNGRFGSDVMPAGFHTFLNPLLDVPFYLGIKYLNNFPKLLVFLRSVPCGFFLFFMYKISRLFFPTRSDTWYVWFVVLAGCSGSMFLSQVGTSTGEGWTASLLAASAYLFFRWLVHKRQTYAPVFFAALIAGATAGMKMTVAPFVVALTIVFFCNLKGTRHPWKQFGTFALGGILGFLLTNGYFMLRLWVMYQNPVFPFFNGFFQSPFFEPENWKDARFFPKNTLQWIFYPFYWTLDYSNRVTEAIIRDPRLALGYVFVVRLFIGAWLKKGKIAQRRLIFSLTALLVITYLLWLNMYAILRYAIILEALSISVIIWVFRNWMRPTWGGKIAGIILVLFCWGETVIPDWGHLPFDNHPYIHFEPEFPKVERNALVVFFGHLMSFTAPFFPEDTQFVGGITFDVDKYPESVKWLVHRRMNFPKSYYRYRFDDQIKQKLSAHQGPIYVMAVPWSMMLSPLTLQPYGLKATAERCQAFNVNINTVTSGWELCRVEVIR